MGRPVEPRPGKPYWGPVRDQIPYKKRGNMAAVGAKIGGGVVAVLTFLVVGYIISDLWWSMWLTLGVHWSNAENWSYWYTLTHWGALTPFVAG